MQQFLGMFYWCLTFILRRNMFIPCVQEKNSTKNEIILWWRIRIKDLYDQANVEMFATSVRGRKAFAVEPKIREVKTKILKLNAQKL